MYWIMVALFAIAIGLGIMFLAEGNLAASAACVLVGGIIAIWINRNIDS